MERLEREQTELEWRLFDEECANSVMSSAETQQTDPGPRNSQKLVEEEQGLDEEGIPLNKRKRADYFFRKGYYREDSFEMGRESTVDEESGSREWDESVTHDDSEEEGDVTAFKVTPNAESQTFLPTTPPSRRTSHSSISTVIYNNNTYNPGRP